MRTSLRLLGFFVPDAHEVSHVTGVVVSQHVNVLDVTTDSRRLICFDFEFDGL